MAVSDICRLCLSENNLVWVFDTRFENSDSMRSVVFITTGVQIHTTDVVSQKICEKCCHIIINFYEFRKKSLKNDKLLKDKLKAQKESDGSEFATAPSEVRIKEEPMDTFEEPTNDDTRLPIHPTVKELFELHPHVKLPRICLTADVKPLVVLPMDAVENYYKTRKLNFQEHCKLVLKPKRTARKKTLAASPRSPPCLINGRIIPQQTENSNAGLVQPIKIKIIPRVMPNINETGPDKDNINESESIPSDTRKAVPCQRKRKLLDDASPTKENEEPEENKRKLLVDASPTKENEKPEENQSSELQKIHKSLSYVANVSVPLQMCNICDAVHYSAKELKKHRLKHLRCQFCKATFRSLQNKNEHLENKCPIKSTIDNFPSIKVPKVELNTDIVTKYATAFSDFPSLLKTQNEEVDSKMVVLSSDSEEERPKLEPKESVTAEDTSDVIEILSDDDDTCSTKDNPPVNSVPVPSTKVPVIQAIKPDVNIRNGTVQYVVDQSSNEMLALKNLLTQVANFDLSAAKEVQTETPHQNNIEVNEQEQSATFNHFTQHLYVFRVPVKIKNGQSFKVAYNYTVDKPKPKNLRFWNDLTPVDIEKSSTGTAAATQHTGSSNKAVSTLDQAEPIAEEVIECDKSDASIVPDKDGSSTLKSGSDKTVNSTHNHISTVGLAAAATFPSARTTVSPPIVCATAEATRISAPHTSSNISVSTSALSSAPIQSNALREFANMAYQKPVSPPVCPTTEARRNPPPPTSTSSNISVLISALSSAPIQGNALSELADMIYQKPVSPPVCPTTEARRNSPPPTSTFSNISVPTSTLSSAPIQGNTLSELPNMTNKKPVSSPIVCPTTIAKRISPPPATSTPIQNNALRELANMTNKTSSPPNSVVTLSHSIPPNNVSNVTSAAPSNNESHKPITFKIPHLYKQQSPAVLNSNNVFNKARLKHTPSRTENIQSATATPTPPSYSQILPTPFYANIDRTSPAALNPPLRAIIPKPTESSGTKHNTVDVRKTYWPPTCHSASLPTPYSVGYSNVPVMVINDGDRGPAPQAQNAYPLTPNSRVPPTILTHSMSVPVETARSSLPIPAPPVSKSAEVPNSGSLVRSYMYTAATQGQQPQLENLLSGPQNTAMQATLPQLSTPTFENMRISTTVTNNNFVNPTLSRAASGNVSDNSLLDVSARPSSVNSFTQVSGISPSSCQTQQTLERPCSLPASAPQFGHIRVRNMNELI